jgi:hypothetical protein
MKIRNLFEDYDEDELFWESMQDAGWEPHGMSLVSKRNQRISVDRDRWMYDRDIEIGTYTNKKYAELLRFESDPEVQKKYKTLLRFASRAVQLSAVQQNWWAIRHIENPSEALKFAAVRQNGYAIQYIEDPSEALQLAAVQENGFALQYIKNPSEAVKRAARAHR